MKLSKNLLANLFILFVFLGVGAYLIKTPEHHDFKARVVKVHAGTITVEPEKGSRERQTSDTINVKLGKFTVIQNESGFKAPPGYIKEGDNVKVTYDGSLRETHPFRIDNTYAISRISSLKK